jgi:hypothetical protein
MRHIWQAVALALLAAGLLIAAVGAVIAWAGAEIWPHPPP